MYLNDYRKICAVCPSIGNAKELKECLRLTWSEGSCYFHLITACKELCEGYVFNTCLSFCSGEGVYPSMPCRSLGGYVSQHALQVSRPTSRGELGRSGQGGSPGLHTVGKLRVWPRGSPGPHPGGVSQHALSRPPQLMATAASGTHPTGMHSCYIQFFVLIEE